MELIFFIVAGIAIVGIVLAVVERRRKRVFLAHDAALDDKPQTEADRQMIRTTDAVKERNKETGSQSL